MEASRLAVSTSSAAGSEGSRLPPPAPWAPLLPACLIHLPVLQCPPPPLLLPADKQTFPQQDVVGWYTTGADISDADMPIQRKVRGGEAEGRLLATLPQALCLSRTAASRPIYFPLQTAL
jgi:hypothetical protein